LNLVLKFVLLLLVVLELIEPLFALHIHKFSLLGFFLLMHDDCVFYLVLFLFSFITHSKDVLAMLLLSLLLLTGSLKLRILTFVVYLLKS